MGKEILKRIYTKWLTLPIVTLFQIPWFAGRWRFSGCKSIYNEEGNNEPEDSEEDCLHMLRCFFGKAFCNGFFPSLFYLYPMGRFLLPREPGLFFGNPLLFLPGWLLRLLLLLLFLPCSLVRHWSFLRPLSSEEHSSGFVRLKAWDLLEDKQPLERANNGGLTYEDQNKSLWGTGS